ncbi:hypothetical protein Afil01_59180 [Actinorhabdospora filicis]|uniref:DUF4386 domain-containing protein n=1 Tax=Actinorhabdospora filicis TaxID=1785913 RepID=A0A9W6WD03_9ACTN|nr:hypothetical protein [Actinorhabdospora filicis]GLZ81111.1 hypothetical protein Afil01_59180 [Actinorhabdospora filicis]
MRTGRSLILAGIPVVMAFLVGMIAALAIGDGAYPSPFLDQDVILDWLSKNSDAAQIMSLTQLISALALLVFSARLAESLRQRDNVAHAAIVQSAGAVSSLMLAMSALLEWVAVRPDVLTSAPAARLVHDLSFLTGGPGHVAALGLMIGTAALGLAKSRTIPSWLTVLGAIVGVAGILSVASLMTETAAYLLPIARFPGFIWIVGATVVLLKRDKVAADVLV